MLTLLLIPKIAMAQVVVSDGPGLTAALSSAVPGDEITLVPGLYETDAPLVVPDGVTVRGSGVMAYDAEGLPTGFVPGTASHIRPSVVFSGEIITLHHEAAIHDLLVEDISRPSTGPVGNTVGIVSRRPGDVLSASVDECVIIMPNPGGRGGPIGPSGRGIYIGSLTQIGDAPAHEDSTITARVSRSVIRTNDGIVVFAVNFAAGGNMTAEFTGNRMEGLFDAVGGVSRGSFTQGSVLHVRSRGNLYVRPGTSTVSRTGLNMAGGSGAPAPVGPVGLETVGNTLRFHSVGDRVVGFTYGVNVAGGQRFLASTGLSLGNRAELVFHDLHVESTERDFVLNGARAGIYPVGSTTIRAGDDNVLTVLVRDSTGANRINEYAHSWSGSEPGDGNRLEIAGSPTSFAITNPCDTSCIPVPPADVFAAD
jgi:hypothetical protein